MLSRVANSLYWMSRYLERAEHTTRVVDVNLVQMLDQSPTHAEQRWNRMLTSLVVSLPDLAAHDPQSIMKALTFDRSSPTSIISMLGNARDNARQVRAQLSSEMWEQLNRLYLQLLQISNDEQWHAQPHALFRTIKEGLLLFQGITDSTMPRSEGWLFLQVGRFLERGGATAALLDAYMQAPPVPDGQVATGREYLDWVSLLKSQTAFEAYCQVYTADLRLPWVASFLLLDADFPHSVRFSVGQVQSALAAISRVTSERNGVQIERLVGRLRARLEYDQIDELIAGDLHEHLREIQRQCAQLHSLIKDLYLQPPLQAVLVS
jgi:uncharacterized alpha-E superfamily protein